MITEKNVYITSDLHLWHKNIIKYCNRPYDISDEGIKKMNEDLLLEFDRLPEGSVIINNGDLLMGCSDFEKISEVTKRMKLNNKKLCLIMGNHDRELKKFLKQKKDFESSKEIFEKAGFDFVSPVPILINNHFIFSHEPIIVSGDFINVYGHTHDKDFDYKEANVSKEKYLNVCWDKLHKFITLEELYNAFKS